MVSNHITVDTIIAIPTISCAVPVRVNQAIKKPSKVNICAIDSFTTSTIHLIIAFILIFFISFHIHGNGLTIKDTMPFIIWMNISIPLFIYLGISFKTLYIFMINHLTMLYGNPSKLFRSPTTFLINFKMVS